MKDGRDKTRRWRLWQRGGRREQSQRGSSARSRGSVLAVTANVYSLARSSALVSVAMFQTAYGQLESCLYQLVPLLATISLLPLRYTDASLYLPATTPAQRSSIFHVQFYELMKHAAPRPLAPCIRGLSFVLSSLPCLKFLLKLDSIESTDCRYRNEDNSRRDRYASRKYRS